MKKIPVIAILLLSINGVYAMEHYSPENIINPVTGQMKYMNEKACKYLPAEQKGEYILYKNSPIQYFENTNFHTFLMIN